MRYREESDVIGKRIAEVTVSLPDKRSTGRPGQNGLFKHPGCIERASPNIANRK